MERKWGPPPILSIVHTVTIGTMLHFDCRSNWHGLKNVTCKQTLMNSALVKIDYLSGNLKNKKKSYHSIMASVNAMRYPGAIRSDICALLCCTKIK